MAGCELPAAEAQAPPNTDIPRSDAPPPPDRTVPAAGQQREARPDWWRHDNERWIVGDCGRQPDVVPLPYQVAPERPDTVLDGARLGGIDYRAVSLRGLSHQQAGTPRQDAYQVRITANQQWLAGCVADGVSDRRFSHLAADQACQAISVTLAAAAANLPPVAHAADWPVLAKQLPWQEAVDRACESIVWAAGRVHSGQDGGPGAPEPAPAGGIDQARELMATTALAFLVAARPTADGLIPWALAVGAGDSSAMILSASIWHPVTAVKNDGAEIASNAVVALPRRVEVAAQTGFLAPGEALMVVSDGIGDPLGRGAGMVGRFLATHWSQAPDVLTFATHAAFYRKTYTDDRTAVVVWHRPPPGQPPDGPTVPAAPAEPSRPGEPEVGQ